MSQTPNPRKRSAQPNLDAIEPELKRRLALEGYAPPDDLSPEELIDLEDLVEAWGLPCRVSLRQSQRALS